MKGQRPVAKFTAGQVSAAIWENQATTKAGKQVTMLKATVERRYKDKDGWKSSGSFSRNEIPLAAETADGLDVEAKRLAASDPGEISEDTPMADSGLHSFFGSHFISVLKSDRKLAPGEVFVQELQELLLAAPVHVGVPPRITCFVTIASLLLPSRVY